MGEFFSLTWEDMCLFMVDLPFTLSSLVHSLANFEFLLVERRGWRKEARRISKERAMDCVFGFTAAHDVSARDWQLKKNGGQWLLGKSMEAFAPIGPAIVSKEEIGDPNNLNLSCKVNGEVKQDSNTSQFVFNVSDVISWVSIFTTLYPGDIILTGTPPGVGAFMKPPQFLKVGDVVECSVEKIGTVVNKIVEEK